MTNTEATTRTDLIRTIGRNEEAIRALDDAIGALSRLANGRDGTYANVMNDYATEMQNERASFRYQITAAQAKLGRIQ